MSFESNCELFASYDPVAALHLRQADLSHLEPVGEGNLLWKGEDKAFFLHDQQDPEGEAKEWIAQQDLAKTDVVYCFGIGLGYSFTFLLPWLEEASDRRLIYLEDDLAVLNYFFRTERAKKLLTHPQVEIITVHRIEEEGSTFQTLTWEHLLKQIKVLVLPSYKAHRPQVANLLADRLTYESANKNDIVSEFLEHGAIFYKNYYANLKHLHTCCHGNKVFGKFWKVPAIVCGAGPSINRQLDLLGELRDKALILAGGSAINVLNGGGFNPHFGGGIDPNPDQYIRYQQNRAYEVPFFFRPRLQAEAFLAIDGPKLYVNGSGGYETSEWLDKQLGIDDKPVDEGHNIVNFLSRIAVRLGCDPIIFVGMDLAYTSMEAYASNVIAHPGVKQEEIISTDLFETDAVVREDIYGQPVYTMWKWIAESQWTTDLAKEHRDRTFINATEGGIGFEGIPNQALHEVAEQYLQDVYDLEGMVHQSVQQAQFSGLTQETIAEKMEQLRASLQRCEEHLRILVEDSRRMMEKQEQGKPIPPEGVSGLGALASLDLKEEAAYEAVLAIFEKVMRHYLGEKVKDPKNAHKLWTFLHETTLANLELMELYHG